ncbi:Uncharacterised protein [Serratia quinivorans]|nr:Uncharacterised protein [Serratia quinivorans]
MRVKESEAWYDYHIEMYIFIFSSFTLGIKRKGFEKELAGEINRRQAGARLGNP